MLTQNESYSHGETVLVVDDSPATVEVLSRNLELHGYRVLCAGNCKQAMALLEKQRIDLVVTDLRMPGSSGLDLIRHVKDNFRDIEILMITGYPSIETAVRAVREGAVNYLPKPFTDHELLCAVEDAAKKSRLLRAQRDPQKFRAPIRGFIGISPPMMRLYELIEGAAKTDECVLLLGDAGTGKELTARAIHDLSPQADCPFIPVNCEHIPKNGVKQVLLGNLKKGKSQGGGILHAAGGGTIYLKNFTSASPADQEHLSTLLADRHKTKSKEKEKEARRKRRANIRIMAGTNRDINLLTRAGSLQVNLRNQLRTLELEIPALRSRGEDVVLLARHFAQKCSEELGFATFEFSERALDVLMAHSWPGNVRELSTTIMRLASLSQGSSIDAVDLPSLLRFHIDLSTTASRSLSDVEGEHIIRVLSFCDQNISRASEVLGIDRKTLRTKLKRIREA